MEEEKRRSLKENQDDPKVVHQLRQQIQVSMYSSSCLTKGLNV